LLCLTRIVEFNLSKGNIYIIEIKEVNKTLGKVVVNIDKTNYSIAENSSEKIDLNGNGYYDLEISAENKEGVTGNVVKIMEEL